MFSETTQGPTKRWTPMIPKKKQILLWLCRSRNVAVPAGRGSGKTEIAKRKLVASLAEPKPWPDPRYFFGGPTHEQAKKIAWEDLKALTPKSWLAPGAKGISEGELKITTKWGAELHVIGLDKPERAEGVQWDGCVLDESCDLKPKIYDLNIGPALTHRNGWCWRIGVPKRQGRSAREYREFYEKCLALQNDEYAAFSWPSSDILDAATIKQRRDNLDPKDFREQYEASFESAGGGIFYAFESKFNIRPCSYIRTKTIIVGCDFNVDPMSWVFGHYYADKNCFEWFDEIWERDTNTQACLEILTGRYGQHLGGFEFFGDASSKARKTSASMSDYQQILDNKVLKTLGRTVHFPDSNPAVADRFAACNAMFKNASGDRRMFVDKRCENLVRDLEARFYKPGTCEPADKGDLGHITDAMGYPIHAMFPLRIALEFENSEVSTSL